MNRSTMICFNVASYPKHSLHKIKARLLLATATMRLQVIRRCQILIKRDSHQSARCRLIIWEKRWRHHKQNLNKYNQIRINLVHLRAMKENIYMRCRGRTWGTLSTYQINNLASPYKRRRLRNSKKYWTKWDMTTITIMLRFRNSRKRIASSRSPNSSGC